MSLQGISHGSADPLPNGDLKLQLGAIPHSRLLGFDVAFASPCGAAVQNLVNRKVVLPLEKRHVDFKIHELPRKEETFRWR